MDFCGSLEKREHTNSQNSNHLIFLPAMLNEGKESLNHLNELRQSLALLSMPQTRSVAVPLDMKKGKSAMKKFGEEVPVLGVAEGQSSPIEIDEDHEEQGAELDISDSDTEVWLRKIKLWEYANLPWSAWEKNTKAKEQFDYLKNTGGFVAQRMQITPEFVAAAFQLPHTNDPSVLKVTDQVMRGEFGAPEGQKQYYMVRNAPLQRQTQLRWFLSNVCMLVKTLYMSKESYALLHSAEKGLNVDWGSLLHEKLQFYAGLRDKRRKVSVERLAPYMAGLFSYRDWISSIPPVADQGNVLEGPMGSESRKRKLQYALESSQKHSDEEDLIFVGYTKEEVFEVVGKKKPSLVVFDEGKAGCSKVESTIVGHKLKLPNWKGTSKLALQPSTSLVPTTPITPSTQMVVSTVFDVPVKADDAITKLFGIQHYIRQQAKNRGETNAL